MARIRISQVIDRTPSEVWNEMRHIERHVNWMKDAVSITFTSETTEGVGTSFLCLTKVGPLKTQDAMTITEWRENEAMGVTHVGLIKGSGAFLLSTTVGGCLVSWEERLIFPWWAFGEIGAQIAKPVLRGIWKLNLGNLASLVVKS
jgi:hypothetical protein